MKGFEVLVDAMLYAAVFGTISASITYLAHSGAALSASAAGILGMAKELALEAVNGNIIAAAALGSVAGVAYYAARQTYRVLLVLGAIGAALLALFLL